MSGTGPLILIVEPQLEFADDARALLNGRRVVTARSMAEAVEIAEGGRVDIVILGPSFGTESGIAGSGALLTADPEVSIVLVANVLTNRVLRAALRMGLVDVVDTPLTLRKVHAMIGAVDTTHPAGASFDDVTPMPAPTTATTTHGAVVAVEFNGEADRPAPEVTMRGPAFASATVTGATTEPSEGEAPAQGTVTRFPPPGPAIQPPTAPHEPPPVPPLAAEALPPPPIEPPPVPSASLTVAVEPIPAEPPPAVRPVPPPEPEPPRDLLAEIDGPDDDATDLDDGDERSQVTVPSSRSRSAGNGTIITVMAGKGGSGKTVTATNLAMALTGSIGEDRVALLDADLQFGDVALLLQLDPGRTIVDASQAIDDLTEARLDGLLLRHESGLRVLAAPPNPSSSGQVPPKKVVRLMEMLAGMYEYVIVDTAPIFDDALMTILDHSDEVVLVVDMDLPSVKNAKIALDTLRTTGYPMGRVHLLVNRVNSKARLDLVELERALDMDVAASVPSDRLMPQSVNEGVPAVAMSPRSRVAKAFRALADLFLP